METKKKSARKTVKKQAKKPAEPAASDPVVEVSYKTPQIITESADNTVENQPVESKTEDVRIEEMKETPSEVENVPKPESGPVPDDSTPRQPESSSGVFIWIAILVVLAIIVAIVNLDKIMPPQDDIGDITSDIVATVNGEPITQAELDRFYNISVPDALKMTVSKEVFLEKSLIPQKVLLQEAKNNDIIVSDQEIEEEIAELAESSGLSQEEFMASLKETGITEEDINLLYKNKITVDKLLDKTVLADQDITLPELVRASHILVEDKELAESIKSQLDAGSSFEELASNYSIDSTAANGGDLGYFPEGAMVPEFEEAAFALEPGQVSDIVETDFGFHLIKLTDKLAAGTYKYQDIDNPVQKQLAVNEQMSSIQTYTNMLVERSEITMRQDNGTDGSTTTILSSGLDQFVECLAEKSTLYGAEWCQPCVRQKNIFGSAFAKLDYVICTGSSNDPQIDKCEEAGIIKYPTWIIGDKKLEGIQSLSALSEVTGCEI